jgi:TrmH family RNA methyltransferase
MKRIASRENPLLKLLSRLSRDSTSYRRQQQCWLEGDHLCRAALMRGIEPKLAVFSESCWQHQGASWSVSQDRLVLLPDVLFAQISGLRSPAAMGFVIDQASSPSIDPDVASLVLDRVQDAGNVGSMLRSAAAFGFRQVLSLQGTAALWSPKVLRSAMGAHFALQLHEGLSESDVEGLRVPLVVTCVHEGAYLHDLIARATVPNVCAWIMGHEGQGVSRNLLARAHHLVRIAQPGGEESLNVAAAAAICLHASANSIAGMPSRDPDGNFTVP